MQYNQFRMPKKFNKKQSVRFELVPSKDQHGNMVNLFKPVQTQNKLSHHQRDKIINQFADYEIQIDGKPVNQSQIPAFVLEQIRGRADLIFNQKNPDLMFRDDEEYADEQEDEEWDEEEEEGEMIPEEEYMGYGEEEEVMRAGKKEEQTEQVREKEEVREVEVDGEKYKLTGEQLKLLDQVLPENYENYKIKGVQFVKYDEDGLRLDQKQKYEKYIAEPVENRVIIDAYDYVPEKPVDIYDNDLDGQVLKGDVREVEQALNYQGQEPAYEEIEDDFFAKLIGSEQEQVSKKVEKVQKKPEQAFKKKKVQPEVVKAKEKIVEVKKSEEKFVSKFDDIDDDQDYEDEQDYSDCEEQQDYENYEQQHITDEMLDKAIKQFDRKGLNKVQKKTGEKPQQLDIQHVETIPGTGIPVGLSGMDLVRFIENREGCLGRDGQLDWRTLTRRQKVLYMKNKKINQVYLDVRQREIEQKLKDKVNVKAEQLHLKQYIEHIPYSEDHVMQQAIRRDQEEVIDLQAMQNEEDYETESDQDDIISYRAKTSIISSNLATVEEGPSRKQRKKTEMSAMDNGEDNNDEKQAAKDIERIKVIPERRNREETAEQRKQRKEKLKQMKKQKKEQKKQFTQMFENQRKKVVKKDYGISNNPLHKISYIKMI